MTARSASRAPGSLNAHTAMKLITGPVELPLSMVAEYRLDMLGPWESADGAGTEALTTSWVSPDPLHDGGNIFYSEITALYTNGQGNPIYFEGTDPPGPGVPNSPPVVGTPREQFEEGLTVLEWHAYMDVIGQHNM